MSLDFGSLIVLGVWLSCFAGCLWIGRREQADE